jgi:hypothetical protein
VWAPHQSSYRVGGGEGKGGRRPGCRLHRLHLWYRLRLLYFMADLGLKRLFDYLKDLGLQITS